MRGSITARQNNARRLGKKRCAPRGLEVVLATSHCAIGEKKLARHVRGNITALQNNRHPVSTGLILGGIDRGPRSQSKCDQSKKLARALLKDAAPRRATAKPGDGKAAMSAGRERGSVTQSKCDW